MKFEDLPVWITKHLVEDGDCWVTRNERHAGAVELVNPITEGKATLKRLAWIVMGHTYYHKINLFHDCGRLDCVRHLRAGKIGGENWTPVPDGKPEGVERLRASSRWELGVAARTLLERGYRPWQGEDLPPGRFRLEGMQIDWREPEGLNA